MNFSATQIFREIDFRNFTSFLDTECGKDKELQNAITQKKIRETNSLVTSLVKTLISRKKC